MEQNLEPIFQSQLRKGKVCIPYIVLERRLKRYSRQMDEKKIRRIWQTFIENISIAFFDVLR